MKSPSNAIALAGALAAVNSVACAQNAPVNRVVPASPLQASFLAPPANARPWVYWYFMDGHITREGIRTDLEAMKKAGIGGTIFLTVNIGVPQGPVAFMSPQWQELFAYAVSEAKRQGIEIALGTGPGWAGSGGPWVEPEMSMQHLVSSETAVVGPTRFDAVLPRPKPRNPYFGEGSLSPKMREQWNDFYRDETVLAFPAPAGKAHLSKLDDKALYYRAPYTSVANVPPRIDPSTDAAPVPQNETIDASKVIVLTSKVADGRLTWDVPPGNWTVLRFGRTLTGQTTRPAPEAGLGFESDKFSRPAVAAQLDDYVGTIFKKVGPELHTKNGGLTFLHFDSWEMGSQNWSPEFKQEFVTRRGYDPTPYLPTMSGYVVGSAERSERFLWDLRQTASELVIENHALPLKAYAHQRGLGFSVEPYDMNPAGDLDLGSTADLPMGEFWSRGYGYDSNFSVFEAVSVGHTNGKNVIGAESFTAAGDYWRQHPSSMKAQLDWALCAGLNKIVFHTYQHQPDVNRFPGMTMERYGVHWERTQTWWDMVPAFHQYISRSSEMLRQGAPVADILYLTPEGSPDVFTPPADALTNELPDRKGYGFDGCSPRTLMQNATVKNGQIVFPGGASYRVLVLPQWPTMTPQLLQKLNALAQAGATIIGSPPSASPSLTNYPAADTQVRALAAGLWGTGTSRKVGKGRVVRSSLSGANSGPSLEDARWIWFAEGNPAASAPVGKRYFRTTIEVDANRKIQDAVALMTGDNSFRLFINDKLVGAGDNFHNIDSFEAKSFLRPGTNQVRVEAVNDSDTPTGDTPNPAGFIGAIRVFYTDGTRKNYTTGTSWRASQTAGGPLSAVADLGESKTGPWNLATPAAPIYQPYVATAAVLSGMGVAPDFSATVPMRAIHRRLPDGEMYFIANKSEQPIQTVASFRTTGLAPQWWNPLNGETRFLPEYSVAGGVTKVPLRLTGLESGFVVFRKPPAKKAAVQQNFPQAQTLVTLSSPWNVSFDPKWGGPANITFPTLTDWSQNPDEGIKYYSGKAVYRTSFDATTPTAPGNYSLSLGSVKNLASVRINGRDLGSVWCAPWSVNIPAGLLKPTGNQLEVTVANLWVNRLIGDNDKPADKRFTSTTVGNVLSEKDIQPSGLLGPVRLMRAQ